MFSRWALILRYVALAVSVVTAFVLVASLAVDVSPDAKDVVVLARDRTPFRWS